MKKRESWKHIWIFSINDNYGLGKLYEQSLQNLVNFETANI
jgi:hypothetical protein